MNMFDLYLEDYFGFKKSNAAVFLKYCKNFDKKIILNAYRATEDYVAEGMHSALKNKNYIDFLAGIPYNEHILKPRKLYRFIGVGQGDTKTYEMYSKLYERKEKFVYDSLKHFSSWTISMGFVEKFGMYSPYRFGVILSFDFDEHIKTVNVKLFFSYIRDIINRYNQKSNKLRMDGNRNFYDSKYDKDYDREISYLVAESYGCPECEDVVEFILDKIMPEFHDGPRYNEEEFLVIADHIPDVTVEKIKRYF